MKRYMINSKTTFLATCMFLKNISDETMIYVFSFGNQTVLAPKMNCKNILESIAQTSSWLIT